MKYIKKFNESVSGITKKDFEEQCETYLAELYDLGIQVHISVFDSLIVLFINNNEPFFEWDYIKEPMITFLDFLRHKYEIDGIIVNEEYYEGEGEANKELTFEEITSDSFNSDDISYIQIKLI